MFGFSPMKFLFTALIIALVWYGFKYLGREDNNGRNQRGAGDRNDRQGGGSSGGQSGSSQDQGAVDMVKCRTCGDYVPSAGARSCGKDGCPYPG